MKLRIYALVLLGTCSATSFASFEMMLFATDNRIVRYDPENNVALGSFAVGQLGGWSMNALAVNPTGTNQVDALNADGVIRKFNYSTGAYLGAVGLGTGTLYANGPLRMKVLANGNYLVIGYPSTGQVSRIYSPTGTLLSAMNPYGTSYVPLDSAVGADGNIYTLNRLQSGSNYYFYSFVFNSSGAILGFNNLGTSTSSSYFTAIGTAANQILVSGSSGYNTWHGPLGTGQTYTASSWATWYSGDSVVGIAEGHYRSYIVEQASGTSTVTSRIGYYDPGSGFLSQSPYPTPYTTSISSIAIVNAPEPGVWAAMGFGMIAILRRRKRHV